MYLNGEKHFSRTAFSGITDLLMNALFLDDVISVAASLQQNHSDPFEKTTLRHSLRSLQYVKPDNRHLQGQQSVSCRNSEDFAVSDIERNQEYGKAEDSMLSGIYALSLNGYKSYIERYNILNR